VADDETEILNLAVDPAFRRRGIGRLLVDSIRLQAGGTVYLEVRESNQGARKFYERLGFQVVTLRPLYYPDSLEAAIVMKFHSC
jgi:ribosomal-protein-alanine N-acetyltransferase